MAALSTQGIIGIIFMVLFLLILALIGFCLSMKSEATEEEKSAQPQSNGEINLDSFEGKRRASGDHKY